MVSLAAFKRHAIDERRLPDDKGEVLLEKGRRSTRATNLAAHKGSNELAD